MAIVDDKYILELDRLRVSLIGILKRKGLVIDDNETLISLVPKIEEIHINLEQNQDLLYSKLLGEEITEDKENN